MSRDPHEEFRGFCENATNEQLPAIYWKEVDNERPAMAAIAKSVANSRGIKDLEYERARWREDNERMW